MKKHLSLEDIMEFAAIDLVTAESMKLTEKVYAHSRECAECRAALDATLNFFEKTGKRVALRKALSRDRRAVRTARVGREDING